VSPSAWKPDYTERALAFWHEYSATHDLSSFEGQVAAIDPESGRVWIADSGIDVVERVQAEVGEVPVYITRVGSDFYARKGRR
jgi:hypothetical protein